LNSVERVDTALHHREPDRVPLFDFLYNPLSLKKFLGGAKITPSTTMKVWLSLGFDLVCLGLDPPGRYRPRRIGQDLSVDEWGVVSRVEGDVSWYVDGTIRGRDQLEALDIPDPFDEDRYRTLKWALRNYSEDVACSAAAAGVFTQAWSMTGFQTFVRALYGDRAFLRKLLSLLAEVFTEMGKTAIDQGARLIWIADDLGGTRGPMISPKHMRSLIFPQMRKMVRAFKRKDAMVLFHCDGNVVPVMDDIVATGIDAFHPVERKAGMDLASVKERYGQDLSLIGNLEASHLIPWGRFDDIRRQIWECLEIGAPGGGYIFASDHSIHPAISAERARFVYETARRYARYGVVA